MENHAARLWLPICTTRIIVLYAWLSTFKRVVCCTCSVPKFCGVCETASPLQQVIRNNVAIHQLAFFRRSAANAAKPAPLLAAAPARHPDPWPSRPTPADAPDMQPAAPHATAPGRASTSASTTHGPKSSSLEPAGNMISSGSSLSPRAAARERLLSHTWWGQGGGTGGKDFGEQCCKSRLPGCQC